MSNGNATSNAIVTPTPDGGALVNLTMDSDKSIKVGIREIINLVPVVLEGGLYPSYYNESSKITGEQVLKEMGDIVIDEFEMDLTSRQAWANNAGKILKLFASYSEPKTFPWSGCSNVKLPVITISSIQFQARAFESLIPGSESIINVVPTGDEDVDRATRVQKYMNWQLLYKMKEFVPSMDETLMQSPLIGSVFKKTYFSFTKRRPVSIKVNANDIVYPYTMTTFDESPRKTHVLYMTKNDIRKLVSIGVFSPSAWNLGPGTLTFNYSSQIHQARDIIQGTTAPLNLYDTPRIILEQHRDWDLNGDGIAEPYAITVDYELRKVIRITSRSFNDFEGNPVDIEYFTHYRFLPNPEGAYAFGLGTLLLGLNESMNTITNEIIDAGSLANLQGGFIAKRSGVKKGDLKFQMGEWKEVDAYVDDISKAIYTFDFKGPNQTLYATLGLLYEYAKMVASVSETMTGQMPASDTPAQTILALLEEGKKVYSAIYKRHHISFTDELRKIYLLNSIFLSETEYFRVLGEKGVPMGDKMMVGRSDFTGDYDVIPVSDPNMLSRAEKVLTAQQLVTDIRSNPLTAQDANANYRATKRYYEALNIRNIDEILQEPQPPQELSPEEENAKMLTEVSVNVLPQQDHAKHIEVHDAFVTSPIYASELSSNAKNLFERHKKEHLAAFYLNQVGGTAIGNQRMA